MIARVASAFSIAAALALVGCTAKYDRTDISVSSAGDLPVTFNRTIITIPVGGIAIAHIAPFNDDGNPMVGEVTSEDPTVVDVAYSMGDKQYAFFGLKAGRTTVHLFAGGQEVMRIPANIVEQ